jgi:hypothetical protein
MKRISTKSLIAGVVGSILVAGTGALAATWDSNNQRMNPVKGEAVGYDRSDCLTPDLQGYFVFQDKPGVTYNSVGWFDNKASCITLGPRTRIRIYQRREFGGSQLNVQNDDYDAIKVYVLSGWWDDTLSSIKVWTM